MRILVDTREKPHAIAGILSYFDRSGIEHVPQKLEIGDYQLEGHPELVVDRKQNLSELCHNLSQGVRGGGDLCRFKKEIQRAHEQGVKLIILCEHGGSIHTLADVSRWKNPRIEKYPFALTGRELMERMYRIHIAYDVEFLFCNKRSTGRMIKEILESGGKIR